MANIKNLFDKNRSGGVLANTTLKKVGDTVESGDYVESNLEEKNRFVPYIDFASASNFARYGSAEKYYSDSIGYIANEYPYDGSLKEKINWNLSASYLDLHIFENEYPRTNGYILLGKTYGTAVTDVGGYDTFATNEQEYIYLQGSPHPSTGSGDLRNYWGEYNRYNTSSLGKYNLEIDGDNGLTLEFWLNKEDYSSANESSKEVVFDLWNSGTFGNSDYGRFRVELTGGATADVLEPIFNIELRSGSAGFSYHSDTTGPHSTTVALSSSTPFTGSWNHFALSFQNTGSNMLGRLYRNGKLEHSLITGSSINSVTGAMVSTIGSLMTSVSGTYGEKGAAKLSASLDDFRYWRRIRPSDKIAKYWFVPVGGGTNTDFTNAATASTKYSYENPLDLGVYYKFNEGIMNSASTDSQDSVILDYSGRTTNGSWTGYSVGSRFTGSAMVLSNAAKSEFKDPIIYTSNPSVSSLLTTKTAEGLMHDQQNNASIYHSFPAWIVEEDEDRGRDTLKNLTQIMGSYFDTLQLQIEALPKIKNVKYPSGSNKPYPFANRLVNNLGLVSSEVFENANALEFLASRDDHRTYAKKLNETKNIIYQNMYNNLTYIFKSKGSEKSFRNLIRCYGIDEELVKLSLYGNDVEYELRNNGDNRIVKKRYADFNKSTRFSSTVFQQTSSTNSNSREFISSSSEVLFRGNTYEAEVIFPNKLNFDSVYYVENDFTVASLYGCHTSGTAGAWATSDVGNFQVQSVRPSIYSTEAYFQLTGTAGGYFPLLTSSLFKDVYSDSKWNFAVKIKPSKYPLAPSVTGSAIGNYDIEFSGYNYVLDILVNSFETSASISSANAGAFLTANKRFFLGSHRQDFTGAVLQKADSKISSLRVWLDYLKSETIKAHAKDAENFGSERPYKSAYISQLSKSLGDNIVQIPQMETLAMDWNFDTVTSSNASGQFSVPDFSSGSTALTSRWGWLGPITQYQHTGLGYDFEASDTGSIDRRYVHSVKQQPPETLNSNDMVSIIDDTTRQIFSRDSRPIDYYFAFEKSMYGIVSEQMLNYFATIIAFNNLIGEPVNRYRQNYKDMEKLRSLYFERVENTPDFEKFVEYFKWIDSSLGTMLMQLAPASSGFSQKLRNVVESHVLERNKYWTKFPSLEMNASDPEAGLRGINELLYSGKRGIAPMPTTATASNCEWWLDRANRNNPNITSGDSSVDSQRDTIRLANDFRSGSGPTLAISRASIATTTTYEGQAYALRNFTKTYKLTVDESPEIHGGSNFPRAKTVEYTHEALKFDSSEQLVISALSIPAKKACDDIIIPNSKFKLEAKVINTTDPDGYLSGKSEIFAPFSLFSSSVTGGYISEIATNFRAKTEINNYHDDIYGDDKGIPVQSPFTNAHVGGRQHRHVNINTSSIDTTLTRPEAWNVAFPNLDEKSIAFPGSAYEDRFLDITGDDGSESSVFGGNVAMSMGAWFKTSESSDSAQIFGRWSDGTVDSNYRDFLCSIYSDGRVKLQMLFYFPPAGSSVNESVITTDAYNDGKWHFVMAGWNYDDQELFIDIDGGKERITTTTYNIAPINRMYRRGRVETGEKGVVIGSSEGVVAPTTYTFNGNIDEVSFFSEGLSAERCAAIYNNGCLVSLGGSANIVSWWRMGDAPGDIINPTAPYGVIYDVVGGYDGTPTEDLSIEEDVPLGNCQVMSFAPRTMVQPRATMIRDAYAKRPLNIANIKWGTGSQVAGNYQIDYQMLQTSGRKLNNRFFVKNEGFMPVVSSSAFISGVVDYAFPRYDLTGTNQYIFVERFNAPGGPDVSSRGSMDINAEEYSVYNELNQRNSIVRDALQKWQTDHCGQFGIVSVSGSVEGYRQPRWQDYATLANYHKINRNPRQTALVKDASREAEFTALYQIDVSNFNRTMASVLGYGTAQSFQEVNQVGYIECEIDAASSHFAFALDKSHLEQTDPDQELWDYQWHLENGVDLAVFDNRSAVPIREEFGVANIGDKLRILKDNAQIIFQYKPVNSSVWEDWAVGTVPAEGNYRLMISLDGSITNCRISNPQYDNWYVQHAIPQSELQYAWINDSYDRSKDQPFGYASNYSIPSASTSTSASAIQFSTASNWGFPAITSGENYPVNYVNMFSLYQTSPPLNPSSYKYVVRNDTRDSQTRVAAGWYDLKNTRLSSDGKTIYADTSSGGSGDGDSAPQYDKAAAGLVGVPPNSYFEWTVDAANTRYLVGLNDNPPAQWGALSGADAYNDMDYAISNVNHGDAAVFENGVLKWSSYDHMATMYGAGWKFRITRIGNEIFYQMDDGSSGKYWRTFYKSDKLVTTKLFPDVTFRDLTGTVGVTSSISDVVVNVESIKNTVEPGYGYTMNYWTASSPPSAILTTGTINSYINNLNGPYGYPSWKQIRTGETPVARNHKNNNILSVMSPPNPCGITLANGVGTGNAINYYNSRSDDFKNFIQPPVEFKYRPLDITNATNGKTVTLRSTYGNNTCLFSEGPSNDGTAASSSIYNFLKMDAYKDEIQIYDRMVEDPTLNAGLASTQYREIVYPRSTNTGLAQTRGRTKYAEVANTVEGTFGLPPTASTFAILSNGPNGIDRGPIARRTFWRDSETLRNRTQGYSSSSFDWYINNSDKNSFGITYTSDDGDAPPVTASWTLTGTLPNSQGYYDGCATSIYGLGRTPIVWDFSWYGFTTFVPATSDYNTTYLEDPGWFLSGSFLAGGTDTAFTSWPSLTREFTSPLDFPDRGELNSANYQTIAGYAGTARSSSDAGTPGYSATYYPTASVYFYHLPFYNTAMFMTATVGARQNIRCWSPATNDFCEEYQAGLGVYGMRWRTAELSGKKPWFDSYEEYAEDIRSVGKSLTIVPQFNISEQMPYYAENFSNNIGDFKKQNDKFLSLPGGNLSSSATEHTQSDGKRGFTEKFFNDYSNSDFQRYFGKIERGQGVVGSTPFKQDRVTLRCNAIKKLLPYQGFYPHQRSLQLASLFSQSLGPYISGLSWSAGNPTDASAVNYGALSLQSALQPYFAPGILYNTIKSGIACDWAAYTGSATTLSASNLSGGFLNQSSNYRIPFESILDPLGDVGFPDETFNVGDNNDAQNLKLLYPTYQTGSDVWLLGSRTMPFLSVDETQSTQDSVYSYNSSRKPFVRISDDDRRDAKQDKAYSLYQMAMSNFLAEIPNFFLQSDEFGNSLTTFVSKKENEIKVTEGETYYMDIVLSKGSGLVMWEDYFNSSSTNLTLYSADDASNPYRTIMGRGIDGHSFGPPVQSGRNVYMTNFNDPGLPLAPAYAPYTPPYYYGASRARIKYVASENLATFTWDDFFANATVEYSNPVLDATFQVLTSSVFSNANPAPASASMMTLSSSLNIFGLASVKDVQYGEGGQVLSVYDSTTTKNNRWVISTKMETPVLNFKNSTPREFGYSRGMWGGYGQTAELAQSLEDGTPVVSTVDSIQLELKNSFPAAPVAAPVGYDNNKHNFLKKAFLDTDLNRKTIGAINRGGKEISEAIVAIPYLTTPTTDADTTGEVYTTKKQFLDGRYFISLGHTSTTSWDVFKELRNNKKATGWAIPGAPPENDQRGTWGVPEAIRNTSISEMAEKMEKYVIPPELDFNTYDDIYDSENFIEPFVMYIFEFKHQLDQQDLADIWQGLMPRISTTAELDSDTISHPRTKIVEFFGDRNIPDTVRWMVFKVKKKSNYNYYKMTADTKDDQNFAGNPFTVGTEDLAYSYNWPYDYCSLIELAELEVGTKFKK